MIERALLTALIAVIVLAAVDTVGGELNDKFMEMNCELENVEICILNEETD